MKKYWTSWYHSERFGLFELHFPWWISGYDYDGNLDNPIVCAAIVANDEQDAREIIESSYRDDVQLTFRFIHEKPDNWSPFCERFPQTVLMQWPDENEIKEEEE